MDYFYLNPPDTEASYVYVRHAKRNENLQNEKYRSSTDNFYEDISDAFRYKYLSFLCNKQPFKRPCVDLRINLQKITYHRQVSPGIEPGSLAPTGIDTSAHLITYGQ